MAVNSFGRPIMVKTDSMQSKKQKLIQYLRKCLASGELKSQVKAVNELNELLKNCTSEYVACFFINGDLIEAMAESMSSCNPKLMKSIFSWFWIIAKSEKFLKPTQASCIVQTCLRIYSVSRGNLPPAESNQITQLVLLILHRLTEEKVKISHICTNSQKTLMHLCKVTLKSTRSDDDTLLNCCFVTVAVFSEGIESNKVPEKQTLKVLLLTLKKIKFVLSNQNLSKNRKWHHVFALLGVLLLRKSEVFSNSADNRTQFLISIHEIISSFLIPFLLSISRESKMNEKLNLAALTLINEWLKLEKYVGNKKPLYVQIAESGLFYSLTVFRFQSDQGSELQSTINSILVQVIMSASQNELRIDSENDDCCKLLQHTLTSGFDALPSKISAWPQVFLQFPKTSVAELSAVLLFFGVNHYFYSSCSVVSKVFSSICHCLTAIPTEFSLNLFKLLWFNFAIMFMNCKDKSRIRKLPEAKSAVISFVEKNEEHFESIFLPHHAVLMWAFQCDIPYLQEKVVDSWLLNLKRTSFLTLQNLCLVSQKAANCVLNALCDTKNATAAKRAVQIFYHLVQKNQDYHTILWKRAFLVFASEPSTETNVYYIVSLLRLCPPVKMDLVMKQSLFSSLLSFWEKWEQRESTSRKNYVIISKIIQLMSTLLFYEESLPLVIATDPKFLSRLEVNLQSPDVCVRYHSSNLFLSVLKFLPPNHQMEPKMNVSPNCILENSADASMELVSVSVNLMTFILKPETENCLALKDELSFDFLRTALLHFLYLFMKYDNSTMQAIFKCFELILDRSKRLNSRKMHAHFVTHSAFPEAVFFYLKITDDLRELFSKNFLDFLADWFTSVYADQLIRHVLISQRRTQAPLISRLYRAILNTSAKLLSFLTEHETNEEISPILQSLESLIDVLISMKYIIPPETINSLKGKKLIFQQRSALSSKKS
nr:PREDICTED: uncharacterized protein LOC109037235 isoform X1 [Bemisia tabaci]